LIGAAVHRLLCLYHCRKYIVPTPMFSSPLGKNHMHGLARAAYANHESSCSHRLGWILNSPPFPRLGAIHSDNFPIISPRQIFFVVLSLPISSSTLVNGSVSQSDEYARVVVHFKDGRSINMVIWEAFNSRSLMSSNCSTDCCMSLTAPRSL
jgi:hypothetical protein